VIGLVDIQEDYEAGYLDMRETLELFSRLRGRANRRVAYVPSGSQKAIQSL
jgi:hypothetical protein